MSTPYERNQADPLSLVGIDDNLLDAIAQTAKNSPRQRAMMRFHEFEEYVQRMLNAVEPGTYVRPHRHVDPDRPEAFVLLKGSVLLVRFSDDGVPVEGIVVSANGPVRAAEVPGGAWHTFLSLQSGTVVFEVTQGPYDAATNKDFAMWAPSEDDVEANQAFIAGLRGQFEHVLPEVAALDQIEAEEDEIC